MGFCSIFLNGKHFSWCKMCNWQTAIGKSSTVFTRKTLNKNKLWHLVIFQSVSHWNFNNLLLHILSIAQHLLWAFLPGSCILQQMEKSHHILARFCLWPLAAFKQKAPSSMLEPCGLQSHQLPCSWREEPQEGIIAEQLPKHFSAICFHVCVPHFWLPVFIKFTLGIDYWLHTNNPLLFNVLFLVN